MRNQKQRDLDLIAFSSDSSSDEEGLFEQCSMMPVRRMAIIDTCNVMYACAGYAINSEPVTSNGEKKKPDALGVLLMVKQLLQEGYDLRMFVPISYMRSYKVANHFVLEQLHRLGFLTVIDDGSHDDLIILEMAKMVGGFVISNDRFRDHLQVKGLQDVIQNRTVLFNFYRVPLSALSRDFVGQRNNHYFFGFRLSLRPTGKAMFAEHNESSFPMAFAQRMIRSQTNTLTALEVLGVIADYVQQEVCRRAVTRPPRLEYFDPESDDYPEEFADFLKLFNSYKLKKMDY